MRYAVEAILAVAVMVFFIDTTTSAATKAVQSAKAMHAEQLAMLDAAQAMALAAMQQAQGQAQGQAQASTDDVLASLRGVQ